MTLHIQRGLALIGFGLLIGLVGVTLLANLFGVLDEQARSIANSQLSRWMSGRDLSSAEIRRDGAFALGRYIVGIRPGRN